MRDLPFIDAHMHMWDLGRLRYPWLAPPFADDGPNGSVEAIATDYLPADYRRAMNAFDLRGAVHVEAGADPADARAETRWLQSLGDGEGVPDAIVAYAALDMDDLDDTLAFHADHARVRGIRHIVNWHPDPRRSYTPRDVTLDPAWQRGFARLGEYGLSFDLQAYPDQFAPLAPLFGRHDNIPVIVNHSGMLIPGDRDGWARWRVGMTALATLPHLSVKISGMGFSFRPWAIGDIQDYVLETIAIFGTDRVMFASDVPTDNLFGGPVMHFDAYDRITAGFSRDERVAMFAGNANRIYRLGKVL